MIIIRSHDGDDEQHFLTLVEKALKGQDVDIHSSVEEVTMEELVSSIAYNSKQQRIYTGRLERNSRRLQEDFSSLNKMFEPVAAFFAELMEQEVPKSSLTLDDMKEIKRRLISEGKLKVNENDD